MRKLITGVDAEGRSCLLEVIDVAPEPVGGGYGMNVARVHATTETPPPPRLSELGLMVDTSLVPGLIRWIVVEHPAHDAHDSPTTFTTLHHSDALDLVFVHEGEGDLLLQDGPHPVAAGDFIVMPGVDHAMKAGPDGCRVVVVSIGTPPPSAG